MSLYDDIDEPPAAAAVATTTTNSGWSNSMQRLLQSQMQSRKNRHVTGHMPYPSSSTSSSANIAGAVNMGGSSLGGGGASSKRSALAPVIDLKRGVANSSGPPNISSMMRSTAASSNDGEYRFNQRTGRLERISSMSAIGQSADPTLPLDMHDEYNPLYPNDYDDVVKRMRQQRVIDRQRRREDEKRGRDKDNKSSSSRRKGHHSGNHRRNAGANDSDGSFEGSPPRGGSTVPSGFSKRPHGANSDSDEEDAIERNKRARAGAAIAPPTSLVQQDAQVLAENNATAESGSRGGGSTNNKLGVGSPANALVGVSSVAAKMMAKMGYVAGRGLGREGQGLTTALQVEKTSRRGGKIINEDTSLRGSTGNTESLVGGGLTHAQAQVIAQAQAQAQAAAAAAGITPGGGTPAHCLGNPSRVILLQNMVGPGEVDEDLEPETAEECTKYGPVVMCMIYEMPNVCDEEAVRIFVEFEQRDAAIRAIHDLNGRFFGGRIVRACFYNEDLFKNLELAEKVASDLDAASSTVNGGVN